MSWIDWNTNVRKGICIVCSGRTKDGCAPLGIVSGMLPCCARHGDRQIRKAYFELMRQHALANEFLEGKEDSPPS